MDIADNNLLEIRSILSSVFGFSEFRGNQESIILSVLSGQDNLVLMPTGGGKSLCYQVPALYFKGLTVVLSPLIALMKDQVDALNAKGVEAAYLNSSLDLAEQKEIENELLKGHIKLLYISPERMMLSRFQSVLKRCEVHLFAIDEAHCVSQWGHDFRPEYSKLGILSELFPGVPTLALTATAGEATRKDIISSLGLKKPKVFIASFDRPNISYSIQKKTKKVENYQRLLCFINDNYSGDSGIVYCLSRKKTEDTAKFLKQNGVKAYAYHAGMNSAKRAVIQDRFLKKKSIVIVATIAFGMGIDKADVRFVAHMDLPKCIESYYQETGRAGRDGLPSMAWMLYGKQEVVMLKRMMNKGRISLKRKKVNNEKLDAMLGLSESIRCRREIILNYFNDPYSGPCMNCDSCIDPVVVNDKINATHEAVLALQCLHETKQKHDITYMINVLIGFADGVIRGNSHHELSCFNQGQNINQEHWINVFRQLIAGGMIKMKMDGSSRLELTSRAIPVIKGEEEIFLRHLSPRAISKKKHEPTKTQETQQQNFDLGRQLETTKVDIDLVEELKTFRSVLAKKGRTKPFKIFSDKTLYEIAQKRPQNITDFESIYGIGPKKLKKYGEIFVNFVAEYNSN